jgi:RNA polymerase sigma factor (sigma-70 family)
MTVLTEKRWFLDLVNTSDEVLVLFAQGGGSQPARDALTCRHWHQLKSRLSWHALRLRLTPWDLDDAHQQAFFWIQEAITGFDPNQLFLARGCSFKTFLQEILRLRLMDYCRSLYRRKKRYRLAGDYRNWLSESLLEEAPVLAVSEEELHLQLDQALRLLDPQARALWRELRQGKRLRDLPDVLGVSYRTLKRRWRTLREQLCVAMQHLNEQKKTPIDI